MIMIWFKSVDFWTSWLVPFTRGQTAKSWEGVVCLLFLRQFCLLHFWCLCLLMFWLAFLLFIAGCVRRKEEIQCWFSACVSFDRGLHFPLLCFPTHQFDCYSTPEISWYYCLHSRVHAYRLGNAYGECHKHSFVS